MHEASSGEVSSHSRRKLAAYIYMNDVIFMIVDIHDAAGTRRSCRRLVLAASWQNMILRYMRHVLFLLLIILAMCFCLQKMPREIITNRNLHVLLRYYRRNYSTPVTPVGWTSNALNANRVPGSLFRGCATTSSIHVGPGARSTVITILHVTLSAHPTKEKRGGGGSEEEEDEEEKKGQREMAAAQNGGERGGCGR
ncbi:hypothetical protein ALC60_12427 [Trachymyrmex zeteki]|uniref:Uncharacterized protein n=1 Tax=Mycetomoellerius zeteki TaxID=64791 RepID=A0A151WL60_9HYME|nr:hypothetical protein ALC60_12427 [Trachymyrmex zeteki]